jgi:hypothetical protein
MQAPASFYVIDAMTGKPLSRLRFPAIPAALNYLSDAILVCSSCGATFDHSSVRNIVSRQGGWEIAFPHECQPHHQKHS